MKFFIVNAFTKVPFGGNTAGVVICDELPSIIMQKIACELQFSETAFIMPLSNDTFSIKFFTPNSEIELCGHAAIASFSVLKYTNYIQNVEACLMRTSSGTLPVYVSNDLIFMETNTPISVPVHKDMLIKRLSEIMKISPDNIGDNIYSLSPQIISTGVYDIILPVKNINILNDLKPDFNALAEFSKEQGVVGVHAFSLDSNNCTANCRNFAPLYAIDEEAATGTSNASLAYYLFKNNVITELNKNYIFKQGEKMGRPSEIITKIIDDGKIKIIVGGSAYIVSEGNLLL